MRKGNLTASEREVHTAAAGGVLRDLHDEIDQLVALAYKWEWPLEEVDILGRLVSLHDQRLREEDAGRVRWVRPELQVVRFGKEPAGAPELDLGEATTKEDREPVEWPDSAVEQIGVIKAALATEPRSLGDLVASFLGADRRLIRRHIETLELLGEVRTAPDGRYHVTEEPAVI